MSWSFGGVATNIKMKRTQHEVWNHSQRSLLFIIEADEKLLSS